jgi:hypothetical protein
VVGRFFLNHGSAITAGVALAGGIGATIGYIVHREAQLSERLAVQTAELSKQLAVEREARENTDRNVAILRRDTELITELRAGKAEDAARAYALERHLNYHFSSEFESLQKRRQEKAAVVTKTEELKLGTEGPDNKES